MPTGWRIVKSKHAVEAFNGDGARIYGGRWNSPGVRMVYTSESVALATLEMLVHLRDPALLAAYSLWALHFDDALVSPLDATGLPTNWRSYPAPAELARIGDEWITDGLSAALQVPSAIIQSESNYLLNPAHPDFSRIEIEVPVPYEFDSRLRR